MPARVPRVTKTEAVVLKRRRFGDSDRIVTLLTPARGKIEAIAKGALRPRSKLAGHLEPMTHVEIMMAHGRTLGIVTQAQTIEPFAALRDDLERLSAGLYLLELADRFTVEEAEADAAYVLLLTALLRLLRGDGHQLVVRSFELALLEATGFRPEWQRCAACRSEVTPDRLVWSPLAGGLLCERCRESHPESEPIDVSVVKVLRLIQDAPYEEAARVRLNQRVAAGMESVMHDLVRAMAERDLGSARFLAAVRHTRPVDDPAATAPDEPASLDGDVTYTPQEPLGASGQTGS
ncbi:MAG: DNA repair protein RecO [Chloroflexi bacterium]|nr:DNA repair protein RecO [Chloroflexota bacterium]